MRIWSAAVLVFVFAARGSDLKTLYDGHQWFELRQALRTDKGTWLYRIAVAVAFNDVQHADNEFRAMLRSTTEADAAEIREAALWIIGLHGRSGRYRHVIPGAKLPDIDQIPTLTVTARAPSRVRGEVNGYLIAPVSINGRAARFAIDVGAAMSVVTESEAKRLGLSAIAGQLSFGWFSGALSKQRLAVARKLDIGKFRFRNVAFGVVPDADLAKFSPELRGAVGLPVLMAMETLRWNRDGDLEFGFPSDTRGESNLCFDGWGPAARIEFQQRKIYAALDTGNPASVWWPPLSRAFPALLEQNGNETKFGIAEGATTEVDAIIVPHLSVRIGSLDVIQNDAPILRGQTTASSAYYAGNLGLDLLMQARQVSIDFKALVLTLE
jgi:hypothetical protein